MIALEQAASRLPHPAPLVRLQAARPRPPVGRLLRVTGARRSRHSDDRRGGELGGVAGPKRRLARLAFAGGARLRPLPACLGSSLRGPAPRRSPRAPRRVPPHIYTPHEIGALMAQARLMSPPLRAATFETLIGLLAVTGMRSGEALRLDRNDVDLEAATIMILATKFNKSRMLAIHPTTLAALAAYADVRDRRWPQPRTTSFFVSNRGARLSCSSLYAGFAQLLNQAGLVPPTGSRRPAPQAT